MHSAPDAVKQDGCVCVTGDEEQARLPGWDSGWRDTQQAAAPGSITHCPLAIWEGHDRPGPDGRIVNPKHPNLLYHLKEMLSWF